MMLCAFYLRSVKFNEFVLHRDVNIINSPDACPSRMSAVQRRLKFLLNGTYVYQLIIAQGLTAPNVDASLVCSVKRSMLN